MTRVCVVLMAVVIGVGTTSAERQSRLPPAISVEEATALTQGWALLAQGLLDEAVTASEETLRRYPRTQAALALVVEAVVARFGAQAALDRYERWLGGRTLEDPYTLRRIARATLWEAVRLPDAGARYDALKALLAAGDAEAAVELSRGVEQGNLADTQIMAALGSGEAVQRLLDRLSEGQPLTMGQLRAIGESRHPLAVKPLVGLLAHTRPEFRAAAAQALGRMQAREALAPLSALLGDMLPDVRLQAAAALWMMNDASGLAVLRQFEDSEYPAVRLAALQATDTKRDSGWLTRAQALLDADDPMVRVQAAVLLARDDGAAAGRTLDALAGHENIAIREAAELAAAAAGPGDLPTLRGLLRHGNASVRVSAAARLLSFWGI